MRVELRPEKDKFEILLSDDGPVYVRSVDEALRLANWIFELAAEHNLPGPSLSYQQINQQLEDLDDHQRAIRQLMVNLQMTNKNLSHDLMLCIDALNNIKDSKCTDVNSRRKAQKAVDALS